MDKMSRQKKGDCLNDMKTEILRVRMTPEEKAALNEQASLHHKNHERIYSERGKVSAGCNEG